MGLGCLREWDVSGRVIREQRRVDPELARDEGKHRRGWRLRRGQAPARVAKGAELGGQPQAVAGAALRADERQVRGAQHVVPGHLGGIDRDGEQAQALLAGEQGAAGHGGLDLLVSGLSYRACLRAAF